MEVEQILVHTDFNLLQVCDAKTLEPKRALTYAQIDPELKGFGICAHPPKDRKRGTTYNYLISEDGVMSVFALNITSKPAKLLWKTPLPCKPCYIHSMAMTDKYAVFIRNVSHLNEISRDGYRSQCEAIPHGFARYNQAVDGMYRVRAGYEDHVLCP